MVRPLKETVSLLGDVLDLPQSLLSALSIDSIEPDIFPDEGPEFWVSLEAWKAHEGLEPASEARAAGEDVYVVGVCSDEFVVDLVHILHVKSVSWSPACSPSWYLMVSGSYL